MLNQKSKDLYMTSNGDITFNTDTGDLQSVDSKGLEIYQQAVLKRLMTEPGDFEIENGVLYL